MLHSSLHDQDSIKNLKPDHRDTPLLRILGFSFPVWLVSGYFIFPLEITWLTIHIKFFSVLTFGFCVGFLFFRLIGGSSKSRKAKLDRQLRDTIDSEREKQLKEGRENGAFEK